VVTFDIENKEQFNKLLDKVSKLGSNRFIMGEMARIVKKFNKANFTLKGSGQYEPLSAKYLKRKKRFKPAAPILVYSGDLRDSIGGSTSKSILKLTAFSATIGTKLSYAKYLDTGTENEDGTVKMPARPPLFLTDKMVEQMIKIYDKNIARGLRTVWAR